MRTWLTLTLSAAVLASTGSAQAVIVLNNGDVANLGALLASGSDRQFIVGDKLFTLQSYTSGQFNPAQISVVGFQAAIPLIGTGFDLTGPFGDGSPGDMTVHEMNLQYTVEVLPAFYVQGYRITDSALLFNGSSSGDGSYARVDESLVDFDSSQPVGQLAVFDTAGPPHATQLQDQMNFFGRRKLEVNKDLRFFAAQVNSTATASFVRQSFSQVPAPGAAALLGFGGLVGLRRRR